MKRLAPAAVALAVVACSRPAPPSTPTPSPSATPAPTPSPTATSTETSTATPTPAPTAAAGPLALPVTAASATTGGGEQPLAKASPTVVDPGAHFRVEVSVPLHDARLSLLDAAGAMVAATGGAEIGAGWTRLTLAPEGPLVSGSAYALKLDGAVERSPHDPDGRAYAPAFWPVLTSGEKPKAEPKKPDRRRRSR